MSDINKHQVDSFDRSSGKGIVGGSSVGARSQFSASPEHDVGLDSQYSTQIQQSQQSPSFNFHSLNTHSLDSLSAMDPCRATQSFDLANAVSTMSINPRQESQVSGSFQPMSGTHSRAQSTTQVAGHSYTSHTAHPAQSASVSNQSSRLHYVLPKGEKTPKREDSIDSASPFFVQSSPEAIVVSSQERCDVSPSRVGSSRMEFPPTPNIHLSGNLDWTTDSDKVSQARSRAEPGRTYAVFRGHIPGLYDTWEECQRQIHRFSNAKFKRHKTEKDALQWLMDCAAEEALVQQDEKEEREDKQRRLERIHRQKRVLRREREKERRNQERESSSNIEEYSTSPPVVTDQKEKVKMKKEVEQGTNCLVATDDTEIRDKRRRPKTEKVFWTESEMKEMERDLDEGRRQINPTSSPPLSTPHAASSMHRRTSAAHSQQTSQQPNVSVPSDVPRIYPFPRREFLSRSPVPRAGFSQPPPNFASGGQGLYPNLGSVRVPDRVSQSVNAPTPPNATFTPPPTVLYTSQGPRIASERSCVHSESEILSNAFEMRRYRQQLGVQKLDEKFWNDKLSMESIHKFSEELQTVNLSYPVYRQQLQAFERKLVLALPLLDTWRDTALAKSMFDSLGVSLQNQCRSQVNYVSLTANPQLLHNFIVTLSLVNRQLDRQKVTRKLDRFSLAVDTVPENHSYWLHLRGLAFEVGITKSDAEWTDILLMKCPSVLVSKVYEKVLEPNESSVWAQLYIEHSAVVTCRTLKGKKSERANVAEDQESQEEEQSDEKEKVFWTPQGKEANAPKRDTRDQRNKFRDFKKREPWKKRSGDKTSPRKMMNKPWQKDRKQRANVAEEESESEKEPSVQEEDTEQELQEGSESDQEVNRAISVLSTFIRQKKTGEFKPKGDEKKKTPLRFGKDTKTQEKFKFKKEEGKERDNTCWNCKQPGHWAGDCPSVKSFRTKDQGQRF